MHLISAIIGSPEVRRVLAVLVIAILAGATIAMIQRPDTASRAPTRTAEPWSPHGAPLSSPTPSDVSSTPPAGTPEPTFLRYEVGLAAGQYTLYQVDRRGRLTADRSVRFDRPSHAPVDRIETADGEEYWRTVVGGFTGWSYVPGESGPFTIREVLRWPDGTTTYREVDGD